MGIVSGLDISHEPIRPAVMFFLMEKQMRKINIVWNGIVGVAPIKIPIAKPKAIFCGSSLRLNSCMNRLLICFLIILPADHDSISI